MIGFNQRLQGSAPFACRCSVTCSKTPAVLSRQTIADTICAAALKWNCVPFDRFYPLRDRIHHGWIAVPQNSDTISCAQSSGDVIHFTRHLRGQTECTTRLAWKGVTASVRRDVMLEF